MTSEIKLKADQLAAAGPYTNGEMEYPVMTRMGDLFTADWKVKLALAGVVYTLNLGSISGDSTATVLTGNAAVDNDQPEFVISVNSGWLIPMELDLCMDVDFDALDDIVECLVTADKTQAYAAGGTATTPSNNLDGGSTGICRNRSDRRHHQSCRFGNPALGEVQADAGCG